MTLYHVVGCACERSVTRPVIGITYLQSAQAKALGIDDGVLVLDVPGERLSDVPSTTISSATLYMETHRWHASK
jgi:hypothetical protein